MTAFDDSAAVVVLTCAEYRAAAGVDRCINGDCAQCWPDAREHSARPREEAANDLLAALQDTLAEAEEILAQLRPKTVELRYTKTDEVIVSWPLRGHGWVPGHVKEQIKALRKFDGEWPYMLWVALWNGTRSGDTLRGDDLLGQIERNLAARAHVYGCGV